MSIPGERLRIDPRLRLRRISVVRGVGRRRLVRIGAVMGLVLAVAAVWGVLRSPLFDVDGLAIEGASRTDPTHIARAANLGATTALVDVDLSAVERDVGLLPWVATAKVRRSWPGTIDIVVTERAPVAVVEVLAVAAATVGWNTESVPVALVDAEGRVLDLRARAPLGLPNISGIPSAGIPGSHVDAPAALAVAAQLPSELAGQVVEIAVRDGERWLVLSEGAEVRLGSADELAEKLVAAATMVSQVDQVGIVVIDVRVPTAPVVRRR